MSLGLIAGREYVEVLRVIQPNHLAVLVKKIGACSKADGYGGRRINAAKLIDHVAFIANKEARNMQPPLSLLRCSDGCDRGVKTGGAYCENYTRLATQNRIATSAPREGATFMSKLPVCSGASAIRAFERAGWLVVRQKGSHVSLKMPGTVSVLTVPLHSELAPGTLRKLIRLSGLSVEQFAEFLNQ